MADLNLDKERAERASQKKLNELKAHNHVPKDTEEGFAAFFMLENMLKQACEQDPELEEEYGLAGEDE